MRVVFADTSFWIATLNPADSLHTRAIDVYSGLGAHRLYTSEMVLTEVFNSLADEGANIRKAVVAFESQLRQQANVVMVPQTSSDFRAAVRFYEQRLDQEWGLTDCASFIVMQRENITEALTYDHHFEQAGFVALLRT